MIEDRLYRLTIPGAIFFFTFAGWLAADPTIHLLKLLKNMGLGGTSSLAVLVLGGGLVILTFGYVCGELCHALGVPDPRILPCVKREFVWKELRSDSFWLLGFVILGVVFVFFVDIHHCKGIGWIALSAAFLVIHAILVRYVMLSAGGTTLELDKYKKKYFKDEALKKSELEYELEMISLYTHMRLAALSDATKQYLTRSWGRVVIGTSSICAVLLAMEAYRLLKLVDAETSMLGAAASSQNTPEMGMVGRYTILNCMIIVILYWSVFRQLAHRKKLYAVVLNSDLDALTNTTKD